METTLDGASQSIWMDTRMPNCHSLKKNIKVDVCIVGAGIGGLTTAYLLQKEGMKVCLLENLEIAGGQSGRTTAQFCTALDDRYYTLEKYHGVEGAKIAAQSHRAAIEKVANIVKEENIECDFKRVKGYLFESADEKDNVLQRELEATHRAGLTDIHLTDCAGPFSKNSALCFPQQVQLHPLKYLKALAEIILQKGGKIFTQTHVSEVKGGEKAYVKTKDGFKVEAKSIVVATNTPINDLFAIHTKQAAYRTYVLAFKIPKGSVKEALYWDTVDPYHYVRLQGDDVLIVGGEDHKTGQSSNPEDCFKRLEYWTQNLVPQAQEVLYRWSGQVMEPVDGIGFLGHNPMDKQNVYVITGDSGNGMTHCTIGAMIIRDQILGRDNPWATLYNPARISLRATGQFMKENLNVAAQYGAWVSPQHSSEELSALATDEGMVIRDGASLVATYKDKTGNLTRVSAACTHLGGIVQWNSVEKTWDCPCHGARYTKEGKVIEGPAIKDLTPLPSPVSSKLNFRNKPDSTQVLSNY